MEGHDLADPFVNARFPALEGDRAVVQRQAVEARPVLARKALEPVESAIFVEGGEIGFEREGRVEDSRAAAGIFRSEEHTSELQSLMRSSYAVFCLKKKKRNCQRKTTLCYKKLTAQQVRSQYVSYICM